MTPERRKKIERALDHRQPDLAVVIDNVWDPHNVGAILRTCDAFGVLDVHLFYSQHPMPKMQELKGKSAASAAKWLRITKWTSAKKLIAHLKKQKMAIVTTDLAAKAHAPKDLAFAKPTALVLGNERDGVSPELSKAATANVQIPMVGFVGSFNVSVAAALLLYEAFRQREAAGMIGTPQLGKRERAALLKKWMAL
jgi:tRNA (guanosine-2'-O-)-methyltransferase